jgi:Tol biopolymer transport system component
LDGRTAFRQKSVAPLLSSDGRYVVFESTAPNLVNNDTNNASDIFLFDRTTGGISLVSGDAAGVGSPAGGRVFANMTPDANWVAMVNYSSNGSSLPPKGHVFVRNNGTSNTVWASSNLVSQLDFLATASSPVLSANGAAVYYYGFNSFVTNLYRFDLATGVNMLVMSEVQGASYPSPSADGLKVAFEKRNLILIWDAPTMSSVTGSVNQAGEPVPSRSGASRPALSADGTRVTFLSDAPLTAAPTKGLTQLYQRDLTAGTTRLLSADANGAAAGDLSAIVPVTTSDGAFVVFESSATAMVPDDLNLAPDVFVTDVAAGTYLLLSGRGGEASSTPFATATLYPASVSVDGRYVAYGSLDLGPATGDTNGVQDVFVRDAQTGVAAPISVSPSGAFTNRFHSQSCVLSADGRRIAWMLVSAGFQGFASVLWRDLDTGESRVVGDMSGNGGSYRNAAPAISPDGRWVAFETTRPTHFIEPGVTDLNPTSDIILQDVIAGTNTVISRSVVGDASGNGMSFGPRFSPDGRWLAFGSWASNLTTNNVTGPRLFVRDLVGHTTIDVSFRPYDGPAGLSPYYVGEAVFSGDSRYIAYTTRDSTIRDNHVGLYDLTADILSNVCVRCSHPTLSGDGQWLAVGATVLGVGNRVQLLDRKTGLVSIFGTNAPKGIFPSGPTRDPILSRDGRYLVFTGDRRAEDPSPKPTLYLRDLARGLTMPLPIDTHGGIGNAGSYLPQLAADGRTLVFASFASDLVTGDYNSRRDVFSVRIGASDTDHDGLDDEWEVAYFGNLSQDGSSDSDQDSLNDGDEFLAGTDPTNNNSVLSVLAIADLLPNTVTVMWSSVAGRTYDVQYIEELGDSWSTLYEGVIADGPSRSVVDHLPPHATRRYYRVVFQP